MSQVPASGPLPAGKLPPVDLERILARIRTTDPRLVVGPRAGEDAAVIAMGPTRLILATDPITFATERIGWYGVHVNANDVAVMGGRPLWFLAVLLLPEGSPRAMAGEIMDDIHETCEQLGIAIAGGHTEITAGLARPIVVGQMVGEAPADGLVTKAGLRAGDAVVLTHGAAIEGTALLAREKAAALVPRVAAERLERARRLLFEPGISVLRAARIATGTCRVHSMHDPTEGGILSGLHELASAGGLGLRAWADRIPVLEETRVVCEALGADPLHLIASGALLLAVSRDDADALVRTFDEEGIPSAVVAEVVPADEGIELQRHGRWQPLVPAPRDEAARILEGRDTA